MNLIELKKKAEAATPGPWEANEDGVATRLNGRYRVVLSSNMYDARRARDSEYIAAANPETVLRLVRVVEAAKAVSREFAEGESNLNRVDALIALREALEGIE